MLIDPADELLGRSGAEGLRDHQIAHDVGGEEIELDGLPVRVRARDRGRVVERAAVAVLESADDRELPLDDVDAGHELEGIGDVGGGELRELLRGEGVDQLVRIRPRGLESLDLGAQHQELLDVAVRFESVAGRQRRQLEVRAVELLRRHAEIHQRGRLVARPAEGEGVDAGGDRLEGEGPVRVGDLHVAPGFAAVRRGRPDQRDGRVRDRSARPAVEDLSANRALPFRRGLFLRRSRRGKAAEDDRRAQSAAEAAPARRGGRSRRGPDSQLPRKDRCRHCRVSSRRIGHDAVKEG